jgi:hypothetical protein
MTENTVKPGFEIEPIKVPEPLPPHDPMDAHWQALIAERDKLKDALEKIKFRNHPGTTNHELAKEALSRTSEET